jgi:hypothetical protein
MGREALCLPLALRSNGRHAICRVRSRHQFYGVEHQAQCVRWHMGCPDGLTRGAGGKSSWYIVLLDGAGSGMRGK